MNPYSLASLSRPEEEEVKTMKTIQAYQSDDGQSASLKPDDVALYEYKLRIADAAKDVLQYIKQTYKAPYNAVSQEDAEIVLQSLAAMNTFKVARHLKRCLRQYQRDLKKYSDVPF